MSKSMATLAAAAMMPLLAVPALAGDPPRASPFAALAPVSAAELGQASGRGGLDLDSVNAAIMRDNAVGSNSVTGSNSIAGSLNGNAGITTVFQNTGNNALFQSSTSVNVTIR